LDEDLAGTTAATAAGGGASPLRAIGALLRRGLDSTLDSSLRGLLRQRLAVPTLRLKGCTPDALLRELDTGLVDVLLDETVYTAEELRALGFTWKTYLLGGFRPSHLRRARERWGADLFRVVVGSVTNLSDLCGKDVKAMRALGLSAAEYSELSGGRMAPATALQQVGFRARDMVALDFSLKDWDEVMRLTPAMMRQCNFEKRTYLEFIHFNDTLRHEFVHRFKFDPFVEEEEEATWSETSATRPTNPTNMPYSMLWQVHSTPSASSNTVTNL
jgi:hypothetical protein